MNSLILLAAGMSSRFGRPKALASLSGTTVIETLQRKLISTDLDEILVVLGAAHEAIMPHVLNHNKVKAVYNKDYKFGQTSSCQAGLRAVSPRAEVVGILPVDLPVISGETVDLLVKHFKVHRPQFLIPTYQGKKGHPSFFQSALRSEFLALSGDVGINAVFQTHQDKTIFLPVDDAGILEGFNTPAEWEALKGRWGL